MFTLSAGTYILQVELRFVLVKVGGVVALTINVERTFAALNAEVLIAVIVAGISSVLSLFLQFWKVPVSIKTKFFDNVTCSKFVLPENIVYPVQFG